MGGYVDRFVSVLSSLHALPMHALAARFHLDSVVIFSKLRSAPRENTTNLLN